MGALPIYVWAMVQAGLIGTAATTAVMLGRGAAGSGASTRTATAVGVGFGIAWASWVLVAVTLAGAGVYRFVPNKAQPWLPLVMSAAIAALLLGTRISAISRMLAQPDALWRLTVPQCFRVVGVTFLMVMALGKLPPVFALAAGLGDIAIGLEAIFVARRIRRGIVRRWVVTWFNVLGLLDLVVATAIGVTAAPGFAHVLSLSPSTEQIALLPLVLIPTTVAPLATTLHVLSLRNIAATRRLAVSAKSETLATSVGV